MNSANPPETKASKPSPKKLTVGGVLLAILLSVYSVARPAINQQFGLNLPPLSASTDNTSTEAPTTEVLKKKSSTEPSEAPPPQEKKSPADKSPADKSSAGKTETTSKSPPPLKVPKSSASEASPPSVEQLDRDIPPVRTSAATPAERVPVERVEQKTAPSSELLHGILKEIGRNEYRSVAGLRYTPGSEEGHRLKHLERHVEDQPNRPGRHGVFLGGMEGALKVIDEAYVKSKQGGRGVQTEESEGRTILTVDLRRKIGYIGGSEGKKRNRPTAFRVRIVLDGDRVITAYPL